MKTKIKGNRFWEQEIIDYRLSGQSGRAFTKDKEYGYTTFMGRLSRKSSSSKTNDRNGSRKAQAKDLKKTFAFSEAQFSDGSYSRLSRKSALFITFPNGLKMEFLDTPSPCWLAELGGLLNARN